MQIKRFEGANMADILSRIRKTLGEDALILSTKKKKTNGLGAFTEEVYEVSAAVDRNPAHGPAPASAVRFVPPAYRAPVEAGPPAFGAAEPSAPPSTDAGQGPAQAPFEAFLSIEKELAPLKDEIRTLKGFLEKISAEKEKGGSAARRERIEELTREVRSLYAMLKDGTAFPAAPPPPGSAPPPPAPPAPPDVPRAEEQGEEWLLRRLAAQGVDSSLGERIRLTARTRRPAGGVVTREELRRVAGAVIESAVRVGDIPTPRGNGPRILAFVGPPGSGKTETVCRVAKFLSGRRARVAVVTVGGNGNGPNDLYERLQRPLGIPVLEATDGETLSRAVATCFGASFLLVDVAGDALRDREAVRRLSAMIRPFGGIEFCLTLPADWDGAGANRLADRLSPLRMHYLAFTKLDGAKRYGGILNVAAATELPVLFLSGSELIPARPYMFSRLLLGAGHGEPERRAS